MAVLVLLFIIVPLIELYAIVQIGQAIGIWWTIALLLVDSLVGAALMRSQSRSAWRRFQLALAESRVPAREVFDGVLVIFGGAAMRARGRRRPDAPDYDVEGTATDVDPDGRRRLP